MLNVSNPYESSAAIQRDPSRSPRIWAWLFLFCSCLLVVLVSAILAAFVAWLAMELFGARFPMNPRSPPHAYGLALVVLGLTVWFLATIVSTILGIATLFLLKRRYTLRSQRVATRLNP
jgi:hypothetical protein